MIGLLRGSAQPALHAGSASPRLHLVVSIVGIVGLLAILRLVRRRRLKAKYSLLWLSVGVVFVVLGLFPSVLDWAARLLGVDYPPELLWLFGTVFLVLVVMHLSWELSRLEERTRVLAEELALLRADRVDSVDSTDRPTGAGRPATDRADLSTRPTAPTPGP